MMDFSVFRIPTSEALDQVDAALFTGDEFLDLEARRNLFMVIGRWKDQLRELERTDTDD
jgi:hypothetical protein